MHPATLHSYPSDLAGGDLLPRLHPLEKSQSNTWEVQDLCSIPGSATDLPPDPEQVTCPLYFSPAGCTVENGSGQGELGGSRGPWALTGCWWHSALRWRVKLLPVAAVLVQRRLGQYIQSLECPGG